MRRRVLPLLAAMVVLGLPSAGHAAEASGSVVGRAANASGQPLADVCVDAVGALGDSSVGSTQTGSDGTYELRGLLPGPYDVTFTDCDPQPTYVMTTRENVTVSEGVTSTADAVLPAGGFLDGRITDGGGTPVGSACVHVVQTGTDLTVVASLLSARDGTFKAGPLPAGEVLLLVADCRPSPSLVAQFVGGGLDPTAATKVPVTAGVTTRVADVALAAGATISGRVDDGTGVAHRGACLSAEPPGVTGLAVTASATSNPDGSFVLGGLPPGTYHVGAGLCPGTDGVGTDVTVTAGQRVTGLALTLPASHVERLAGATRVATALAVADDRPSTTIVLASDAAPTDALAAAPLAASLDAPLLLTSGRTLAPAVLDHVRRNKVTEAVLLGGSDTLGPAVEQALVRAGVTVTRVAGTDRYATAAQVATQLGADSAYVVAGDDWPDAVAVGALAALEGRPILLADRHELPDATLEVLGGMRTVDVVGGRDALGDEVVDAIADAVPRVARVGGADRFDTSNRLVRIGEAEGLPYTASWVTSGASWADGLVAAVAAARGGGPLLLLGPANRQLLDDHAGELASLVVVGGTAQVSAADYTSLAALPAASCAATERC